MRLALQALQAVRESDDPAILDHGELVEQRLNKSKCPCSTEVTGDPLACPLVQEEHIGPVMAADGSVSLEELDSEGRDGALLTALRGVPGHHVAIPLRLHCYTRAITCTPSIATRLYKKYNVRV